MKSFKQFLVEFITNPLIYFKNYINMDSDEKAVDLAWSCEGLLEQYWEEIDEEYKDIDDMSENEVLDFGNWLLGNEHLVREYHGDVDLPSWFYMSQASIVKNSWLIHATDNLSDIIDDGFRYGIEDMQRLGLTTYFTKERKKQPKNEDFYVFAYTPDDFKKYWESGKYGSSLVMFQSSGVRVWHYGDEEEQTLFMAKEARNFIPIYERDNLYTITDKDTDRDIFSSEKYGEVVNWVMKNFTQYRSKIVQRDRN